jgi:hypothetical protein
MNRTLRLAPALLAALALAPLTAAVQADDKPAVTYAVYSRSGSDAPWFNGTNLPTEAAAVAEVERLKKAGCEAFYLADDPASRAVRVYVRANPAVPWREVGAFPTPSEAEVRAAALRKEGYEVFVR